MMRNIKLHDRLLGYGNCGSLKRNIIRTTFITAIASGALHGCPTPTLKWPQAAKVEWKEFSPPDEMFQMIYYGNFLYGLSKNGIRKSFDNGDSWQNVIVDASQSYRVFDIDKDKIWLASGNAILVSDNLEGKNWTTSYTTPSWDGFFSMDFENGYGWATIPMWGFESGLYTKKPDQEWNYEPMGSPGDIIADPIDPENTAYLGADYGLVTRDGGKNWSLAQCKQAATSNGGTIGYPFIWNNKPIFFNDGLYSQNNGPCSPLGIQIDYITKAGNIFYASGSNILYGFEKHVFAGTPNNWTDLGFGHKKEHYEDNFSILAATDSIVLVRQYDHKYFRGTWQK